MYSFQKNHYNTYKETEEYGLYTWGKKQSIELVAEEAPMLDLLDEDFKWPILNMFEKLRKPCLKD